MVLAMVAVNGGRPRNTRIGNDTNVPAPTITLMLPARKPAPKIAPNSTICNHSIDMSASEFLHNKQQDKFWQDTPSPSLLELEARFEFTKGNIR